MDIKELTTASIGGVTFHKVDLPGTATLICQAASQRRRLFLSTANLDFLTVAHSDPAFRASLKCSDLCVADGMPIVWISRMLDLGIPERVAGSDLFDALRVGAGQEALGRPLRIFFFGAPDGVATRAMERLNESGEHVCCVGALSPGYGSVEQLSSPEHIAAINASGADFLVVSLGSVKGQAWIMHNNSALTVPVVSHLGAVISFVAGTIQRAPKSWCNLGLEWLWRVKEEPVLIPRYWANARFLLRLLATEILPSRMGWRTGRSVTNRSPRIP